MLPLKKRILEGTVIRTTYVESEIGRIKCIVLDKLASSLRPKEYVYSNSAEELLLDYSVVSRYRGTVRLLNRVLHRSDERIFREDHIESQGLRMGKCQHSIANNILTSIDGINQMGIVESPDLIPDSINLNFV